jgi:hypothetical protein
LKESGKVKDDTILVKELVSDGAKAVDSDNGYFQGGILALKQRLKERNTHLLN